MTDTIKNFGDVKRIRNKYVEENGKLVRHQEEVVLKNCYILIKENGDSIVGTEKEFKRLGITIPSELKVPTKSSKDGTKGQQNVTE